MAATLLPLVRRPRIRRTASGGFSALVPTAEGPVRVEAPDAAGLVADLFAVVDTEEARIAGLLADAQDAAAVRAVLGSVVLTEDHVIEALAGLQEPAVDAALHAACTVRNAEDRAVR